MYERTPAYVDALLRNYIEDRISGTVTLADKTKITLSDSMLVRNSLKITHELCGDEYKIGTFNLGCLQISFFDDNALLHDFSGAVLSPVYEIKTDDGWESIPMGIYIADGSTVRRKRNTVSLTAYDRGILFDKLISEDQREVEDNAVELIKLACGACEVDFRESGIEMPNTAVNLSPKSRQVQTYRDLVAWCASIMCGYAVIDRTGALTVIPAKYDVSGSDTSVITVDKYLTEEERDSIYVTDTRAYIKTLNAYCGKKLKTYTSGIVQEDTQAAAAVYRMPKNPLIPAGLEDEEYDRINRSWLLFIDGFKQRGVTAKIYGDPAIDAGDALRCSGGDIDQRRSIVGVVTKQEWRYRAYHTIICSAPQIYGKTKPESDVVVDQLEKKLTDAPDYTAGRGIVIDENDKIEAKIGRGLAFDEENRIICTAGGGALKSYFGVFRLRDVCTVNSNGTTTQQNIITSEYKPVLAIVTDNVAMSYDPSSPDFLRRNVWVSGTNESDSNTDNGWITIARYPNNGRWFVRFGVGTELDLMDGVSRASVYNAWKDRFYNYVVLCRGEEGE